MVLYSYTKTRVHYGRKKIVKILSFLCIFSGIIILFWTLLPILSFEIFYAPKFIKLIRPIPIEIREVLENDLFQTLGTSVDYTKASSWFPKAVNIRPSSKTVYSSYALSIPILRIENAKVIVGGDDLAKSLIQYTGPSPGNNGNLVIFGHSTLSWLYNPKDYKSIFTKLTDLENGDDILVTFDNITYRYKVTEMKITSPNDLSVLEQNDEYPYLTLITCVPPGTYFKRLIIRARLEKI